MEVSQPLFFHSAKLVLDPRNGEHFPIDNEEDQTLLFHEPPIEHHVLTLPGLGVELVLDQSLFDELVDDL